MSVAMRGRLVSRQFAQLLPLRYAGRLGEEQRAAAARRLARWHAFVTRTLGPASGLLAIRDVAAVPLARVLGFEVRPAGHREAGRVLVLRVDTRTGPAAVLAVSHWTERLDRHAGVAVREAIACGVRWAICTNGRQVRLIDASRPYSRPFLEFELETTLADPAALALFWGLLRPAALGSSERTGTALTAEVAARSAAYERAIAHGLQDGVRDALVLLAHALDRNARRRNAAPSLKSSSLKPEVLQRPPGAAIVSEALTMVFRLLFLLFAEARALVPMWHPVYRTSYAVHGMRLLADREDPERLWDGLQAISRLAHDGCTLDDLHVTAFNGRLFAPEHTPLERRARIDNPTIRQVLRSLTDVADGSGAVHGVAYADLDVEQLGSIYERLLDAAPVLERDLEASVPPRRAPSHDGNSDKQEGDSQPPAARLRTRTSGIRKESGTFYTPRPLAEHLVRDTLEPLVKGRTPQQILELRVLDPAMGSGAFLVAACRYLGDAYARALEESGKVDAFGDPDRHRAACRRLVAQRCLYGVDVNPVATGLARLSLWLATLAADVPLTFLDHHLLTGDSLAGTSLDAMARGWSMRGPTRRTRPAEPVLPFGSDELTGMLRGLLPLRARLAAPDERVELVREKERWLGVSLREGALARWLTLADAWCARWWWPAGQPRLPPSAWGEIADRVLHDRTSLPRTVVEQWLDTSRIVASGRRFLHWPLHFPEVFFDADGQPRPDAGFDAIVGNPPWDMVRDDAREGAVRAARGAETSGLLRFARESGLYTRAHGGHLNRYQLFVERSLALLRPGGRLGLVLPWGVAADQASSMLRRQLFESCDTDRIIAFENSEAIFPIHRSVRFVLLTATTGRPTSAVACHIG
ncbi:MAG TPA: N-6 DNA methylase, partial [Vicinamibacterales bacterium]